MTLPASSDENPPIQSPLPQRGAGHTNAPRAMTALLAIGGSALLSGGVFLLPFALSPNAIQNDVYMTNLFLSPLFLVVGAASLVVGFIWMTVSHELRRHAQWARGRALLLAVVGAALVTVASFLFGGQYESFGPSTVYWPPYLNMTMLVFAVAVAVLAGVAGWVWGAGAPSASESSRVDRPGDASATPV